MSAEVKRGRKPIGEAPMTTAERQRHRRAKLSKELDMAEQAFACPKCASPMSMQVQAVISAPSGMMHKFSKENLTRKSVRLMGVLWETADHICTNPDCSHVINGYGNYVTNLKKRVDELEAQLKEKP